MRQFTKFAVMVIIGFVGSTVLADEVTIGPAKIVERIVKDSNNKHDLVIKRDPNSTRLITKVVKQIPAAFSGQITKITRGGTAVLIDTDGDDIPDATEITWTFSPPLGQNDLRTVSYTTEKEDNGATNDIEVTSTDASGQNEEDNLGQDQVQPNELKPQALSLSADSSGPGISFDALTGTLSFSEDFLVDTGFPGDPLLGDAVDIPDFELLNVTGTEVIFDIVTTSDGFFAVHNGPNNHLTSAINSLTYDINDNIFFADLFHVALAGVDPSSPFFDLFLDNVISSPFLQALDDILNPGSQAHDPSKLLYVTFTPVDDFLAVSNGFMDSVTLEFNNQIGAASPVPEPSTIILFGIGLAGLAGAEVRRRRKREQFVKAR